MTHRARFARTMHFQAVDRVPDYEWGYWDEVFEIWHEQGLPREIDSGSKAYHYFGFDDKPCFSPSQGLLPPFERKVLEERDHHTLIRDEGGVTCEVHASGQASIPHCVDFTLKHRASWESEFVPRLDPDDPGRRDQAALDATLKATRNRGLPLGITYGSLFGFIRDWAGFETTTMMVYDDPELLEEMMERLTQISLRTVEWAASHVQFDFAYGYEDMCYSKGPMISPKDVERLMVPRYRRITQVLRRHGCDVISVDCDGRIDDLVPLWLEAGINGMLPVEAAATDPVALRETYGHRVLLEGGVNKRALIAGKDAIRAEIQRIAPYVREGGWIPHVDHLVPPDVSYENYRYYLSCKRDAFGIPEPAPWEERRPAGWGDAQT